MTFRSFAFFLTLAASVAACTTHTANGPCGAGCVPGFVCVDGVCHPSSDGNDAVSTDARDALSNDTGASDAIDDLASTDAGDAGDANAADANDDTAMDGSSGSDANDGATADSGGDVVVDAGPPCGHTGEMCCGNFCMPGNACDGSMMCAAITRDPNECSRASDCTGGQVCGGPTTCTDHGCYICEAPPGAAAFGAACTQSTDCATGLCRGQHCTVPCDLGGTGTADCTAMASNYICTQLLYRTGTAPMTTIVALGTCREGCARLPDCTRAGETCLPQLNFATNTMDFICGVSSGTVPAGGTCVSGSECQSLLCVPGVGDGGTGACTAPCVTDGDCPAAASHCAPISWQRPDGTGQSGHGCLP